VGEVYDENNLGVVMMNIIVLRAFDASTDEYMHMIICLVAI